MTKNKGNWLLNGIKSWMNSDDWQSSNYTIMENMTFASIGVMLYFLMGVGIITMFILSPFWMIPYCIFHFIKDGRTDNDQI